MAVTAADNCFAFLGGRGCGGFSLRLLVRLLGWLQGQFVLG
jgi:hypothetical protein